MRAASGDRRSRALVAAIAAAAFCGAPLASAEIFKCADRTGLERYQNFPCALDSLGSLPSGPASAATTLPTGNAGAAKPNVLTASAAATGRSSGPGEPRVGMTKDEVTASWGEPEETIQDEPREGRIEIWRYADGRSVQFNNKHRAVAVQR